MAALLYQFCLERKVLKMSIFELFVELRNLSLLRLRAVVAKHVDYKHCANHTNEWHLCANALPKEYVTAHRLLERFLEVL